MKIKTGQGEISLVALLGIWSVSALTSLPGLAVSPIMGQLSEKFPGATELELQMLTSLPSLLIIPFVLLAGKLAECIGYAKVLYWGLALFLLSGVLYFFSDSIAELILVSGLLGVGAGMIIPLSTALVSRFFVGDYRSRQFGYVSAITNLTLVVATALTGYLASLYWKLPFAVYLLPAISLLLVPAVFRGNGCAACGNSNASSGDDRKNTFMQGINVKSLVGNMLYYLLITYLVLVVTLNLPFLLEEYGYHSGVAGALISLFFLAIMLPGFFINRIRHFLDGRYRFVSLFVIAIGLLLMLFHSMPMLVAGCVVAGLGYGVAQPLIYDDTADVTTPERASSAMAWVMVMNYVAILLAPFVMDAVQMLSHTKSQQFPFAMNMIVSTFFAVVYFFGRR